MRDDSSGSSMIWPATPVAEDVTGAILGAEAVVKVNFDSLVDDKQNVGKWIAVPNQYCGLPHLLLVNIEWFERHL